METECLVGNGETRTNATELLDGLLRVAQIVRLRFNEWLGHFDLNDGRHAVLTALARNGETGFSQAELADRLGQSESNVSTLIERMQRDGLVNRSRSDADRRKRVLRITSEGLSTLESINASRNSWATRLLNGIPTDDRTMLVVMLERLGSSLDASIVISPVRVKPETTLHETRTTRLPPAVTDPTDDPLSPQFALRQLLREISSSADTKSFEKDAA